MNNELPVKYTLRTIQKDGGDMMDFSMYSFAHFLKNAGHLLKSHRHDFYSFILCLGGSGSHIIDFEEYEILPNRLFFINYDQIHTWKLNDDIKGYILLFTKSFYNLIFTGNDLVKSDTAVENLPVFVDIPEDELPFWLHTFENIKLEFKKEGAVTDEIICLLLKSCVLKMDSLSDRNQSDFVTPDYRETLVIEFKKRVNKNFREWKSTRDYAQLLSVTPNYLNILVKEFTGKPAGEIIRQRVILEAKRLLSHTDLSVRQISLELGFTDNSHFGKYFKKAAGITPDNFRKNSYGG